MATAHWASRLLYVAAQMNLADRLAEGPRTADELAKSTASDASSLYRLMRTLASLGLFTKDPKHQFSLTPLDEALKTDTPGSVRASVLTLAGDLFTNHWSSCFIRFRPGKPGSRRPFMPLFEWLASHSAEASMFSKTMVGLYGAEPAAVAAVYDFSQFETIIDLGGATGNLLATILGHHPEPRGIVFDQPHVVGEAPALIQARGLADCIRIEAGNFFESVPAGGDAYLLSRILHNWSETQCLTILGNCRRTMNRGSRVLIIEMVLPTGDTPHPGKIFDIIMLTIPGGQERTELEYRELLDNAGSGLGGLYRPNRQ